MIQVVDQGAQDVGVFLDHPEYSVAPVAQESTGNSCGVAVVNDEIATTWMLTLGIRESFADSADTSLIGESGGEFIGSDAVPVLEPPVSTVLAVPFTQCGSTLGFVPSSVDKRLCPPVGQTGPSVSVLVGELDFDFSETPCAPSSVSFWVDFSESVFEVEGTSTYPSTPTTILFDRNQPTTSAVGTSVLDVYFGQHMAVVSAIASVPTDVFNGLVFDPPPPVLVPGCDGCFLPATTVAETVGNLTCGIAA